MICRKKALFKSCAKYLLNSNSPVCVPNAWASGGDALSFSISRRIAAEKQPNKQVIDAAAAAAAEAKVINIEDRNYKRWKRRKVKVVGFPTDGARNLH